MPCDPPQNIGEIAVHLYRAFRRNEQRLAQKLEKKLKGLYQLPQRQFEEMLLQWHHLLKAQSLAYDRVGSYFNNPDRPPEHAPSEYVLLPHPLVMERVGDSIRWHPITGLSSFFLYALEVGEERIARSKPTEVTKLSTPDYPSLSDDPLDAFIPVEDRYPGASLMSQLIMDETILAVEHHALFMNILFRDFEDGNRCESMDIFNQFSSKRETLVICLDDPITPNDTEAVFRRIVNNEPKARYSKRAGFWNQFL